MVDVSPETPSENRRPLRKDFRNDIQFFCSGKGFEWHKPEDPQLKRIVLPFTGESKLWKAKRLMRRPNWEPCYR